MECALHHGVTILALYRYMATMLRDAGVEPMPSLADTRRVVTEYCVLPMGKPLLIMANDGLSLS